MTVSETILFRWCRDQHSAEALSNVFRANLTPSYISHSELQGPRASAPGIWVNDIADVLMGELISRIDAPLDAPPGGQVKLAAGLEIDGKACGVFLVTFSRESLVPYCVLEDLVIKEGLRGQGLGSKYLAWIKSECVSRGIKRLFLESGNDNHQAHQFFKLHGFETISIVMMKTL